ncbi:HNH endonuclease [Winogradskyella sp.]|jgi:5-methylcytosine-specific restriction endonuclease McrA|uniref:HNH endonuclease n=1 Tax=Winogradskyella sp. TaxID=1883156 RepID=UPI0025D61EE2|nr:HNH endonuclease [Winogradskyella sp.]MCT4628296.1 HNH endonuclease [Winogradskyella sp.]
MAERSKELIQVGYYLSKYGKQYPPKRLGTDKWNEAYRMFYDTLNGDRAVLEFEHSLKNSRDGFDSYFPETNREGWKDEDGNPANLTGFSADVYSEFINKDEIQIWSIIKSYLDIDYKIKPVIFNDLIAEDNAGSDSNKTRTEGGIKVRISKTIERSPKLRQEALNIHGYKCQVCNFDFELTYGDWGKEFAEVHHVKPLSELKGEKYETDPYKDLAVLCANCHRMLHRKKGITLTLEELRKKLYKITS